MKILHIIPSIYMGGGQKFAVDLCNELAADEINDVHLCVLGEVDETYLLKQQISPKVTIISLDKKLGFSPSMFYKLYRLIKDMDPDIVHTHLRAFTYCMFAISLLKTPFIHTFHTLAHMEAAGSSKKMLFKVLFDYLGVVPVSIGSTVQDSTTELFGEKHNIMISNGVRPLSKSSNYNVVKKEVEVYKQDKNTKVFLSVGRVAEVKNYLLLINAIKELQEIGEDIIVLILGSLTEEKEYANLCQSAAMDTDKIHFLGEKSNVGDYMYCSDALCLSSIYEGLPLVVLEAMSMGKPVLSTPAGGVPDVVENGFNGYISKDFEVKSYREILQKYCTDPIENSENIKKKYGENYSMQICMNNYYDLYKKMM